MEEQESVDPLIHEIFERKKRLIFRLKENHVVHSKTENPHTHEVGSTTPAHVLLHVHTQTFEPELRILREKCPGLVEILTRR